MNFLVVTIPVSLLLAGILLALVIHAVRSGAFDDWEGPAQRMLHDDDSAPELTTKQRAHGHPVDPGVDQDPAGSSPPPPWPS